MSMHLVSLNIEGHKHLDTVIPFLKREHPDIAFLQEVFKVDIPTLETALGYKHIRFCPLCSILGENRAGHAPLGDIGMALFTHLKTANVKIHYYSGNPAVIPQFTTQPAVINRAVISATFEGPTFQGILAGTHFTWSDHGQTTPLQLKDSQNLLEYLQTLSPHILIGDLNAPRGKEIWNKLATTYRDNIPSETTTTLDPHLHRAGPLPWVIDALFSYPRYQVDNVQVVSGISDHCAITADISLP